MNWISEQVILTQDTLLYQIQNSNLAVHVWKQTTKCIKWDTQKEYTIYKKKTYKKVLFERKFLQIEIGEWKVPLCVMAIQRKYGNEVNSEL